LHNIRGKIVRTPEPIVVVVIGPVIVEVTVEQARIRGIVPVTTALNIIRTLPLILF